MALVLFDIDGTLIRKAGPHHRHALEAAVKQVTGFESTTNGIPTQGMLDRDILRIMLGNVGFSEARTKRSMPELVRVAQAIYVSGRGPMLHSKVCPGVRMLLSRLKRRGIATGLVTGNLTDIGWKKMERAGLEHYFRFGAFAERAHDRAGLVRIAVREARKNGWIKPGSVVSLIGDHPNDILAAQANGVRSIAVATGVVDASELALHKPDLLVADLRALSVDDLIAASAPAASLVSPDRKGGGDSSRGPLPDGRGSLARSGTTELGTAGSGTTELGRADSGTSSNLGTVARIKQ